MATKKTRVSKSRKGAQLKDLRPKKNPKGGSIKDGTSNTLLVGERPPLGVGIALTELRPLKKG
jgi:hypothetical protein